MLIVWWAPSVLRASPEVAPSDPCAVPASIGMRALLTRTNGPVRLTHGKGTTGGVACVWDAFDPGLTSAAPPIAELRAVVYHLPDANATALEFRRSFPGAIVPGEVRTADRTDLVARPDADTVAVRHGGHVAVVSAVDQADAVRSEVGRVYRLETLAFALARATTRGPVDSRVLRDACRPLPPQHVLSVLTLEPSSLAYGVDDGRRCAIRVKDGSLSIGHWVDNDGEVQIDPRDLGTNAAALAFEHRQTPFLPVSSLVGTRDASDRLVLDTARPGEVWVVHGSTYLMLEVTGATAAVRASPGWRYRVQRLAFEAAGATIVASPGTPKDPVVPGPLHPPPEHPDWSPPPHPAPAFAALTDPLIVLVSFFARYRFLLLPVFIIAPALLGGLLPARAGRSRRWRFIPASVPMVLGIGNLLGGTFLSDALVYRFGVAGSATIVSSRTTDTQYNNHDVVRYEVLIRTPGAVTTTAFDDDDFVVYPSRNATIYPGSGDRFTVRYLLHAPRTFVIVADDDSPWATGLRCDRLLRTASDASNRSSFAPTDAALRDATASAIRSAKTARCLE